MNVEEYEQGTGKLLDSYETEDSSPFTDPMQKKINELQAQLDVIMAIPAIATSLKEKIA